jgi:hypothetical protein
MRVYWILPNRDQEDDILASDGGKTIPLREILDPKLRPDGFAPGVPAELLEKVGRKALAEILFAQRSPPGRGTSNSFPCRPPRVSTRRDEWFTSAYCSSSNRTNAQSWNSLMRASLRKTGPTRRL